MSLSFEREGRFWPHREHGRFVSTERLRFFGLQVGHGPDLVLLHGVGGSTHCWAPLIPLLARDWRVTALDLPGHGFTELPDDERLTPEGMRDDLVLALRAFDCAPQVFIGHSAGAALALLLAVDGSTPRPDRPTPRTLLGVNPSLVPPDRMPMPGWLEALARPFVRAGAFAQFWSRMGRNPRMLGRILASTGSQVTPSQQRCYGAIASTPDRVHAALTMMVQWNEEALTSRFASVSQHVERHVLMAGRRDRWIPVQAVRRVAQRIPQAHVIEFDAGHLGPEENPSAILAELNGR